MQRKNKAIKYPPQKNKKQKRKKEKKNGRETVSNK